MCLVGSYLRSGCSELFRGRRYGIAGAISFLTLCTDQRERGVSCSWRYSNEPLARMLGQSAHCSLIAQWGTVLLTSRQSLARVSPTAKNIYFPLTPKQRVTLPTPYCTAWRGTTPDGSLRSMDSSTSRVHSRLIAHSAKCEYRLSVLSLLKTEMLPSIV